MRGTLILLTVLAGASARCQSTQAPGRHAGRAWAEAAASNNADRMVAFYDENAAFIGTTPATIGREEQRALWTRFFGMPGSKLT